MLSALFRGYAILTSSFSRPAQGFDKLGLRDYTVIHGCRTSQYCCIKSHPEVASHTVGSYSCIVSPHGDAAFQFYCYDLDFEVSRAQLSPKEQVQTEGPYYAICDRNQLARCIAAPSKHKMELGRGDMALHGECISIYKIRKVIANSGNRRLCLETFHDMAVRGELSNPGANFWDVDQHDPFDHALGSHFNYESAYTPHVRARVTQDDGKAMKIEYLSLVSRYEPEPRLVQYGDSILDLTYDRPMADRQICAWLGPDERHQFVLSIETKLSQRSTPE